jgi:hypothetical protein
MADVDQCITPNLMFATSQISDYTRNRYRLDTLSSDTANAGRIVTVNLPEASILDLKSFRMFFKVAGNSAGAGGTAVHAYLPDDASTLLSKVEVYINGVQVSSGASEYNTLARLVKIGQSSPDRNGSVDRMNAHSFVATPVSGSSETAYVCISEWHNILGQSSTRFLPTSLVGQVTIRITFAPNSCLIPFAQGQANVYSIDGWAVGGAVSGAANAPAAGTQTDNMALITYTVSEIRFSIDAISVCSAYNQLLAEQLSREGELKLNYKEYYTFIQSGVQVNKFSLASSSIDSMWNGYRNGSYLTVGQPAIAVGASAFGTTAYVTNMLGFNSFDPDTSLIAPVSNLRFQYSINNVLYPQYLAQAEDAMADVAFVHDKVGQGALGVMPNTRDIYKRAYAELPLTLCHPSGMGLSVKSGYNSRGVNSTMIATTSGQTALPTGNNFNNVVVVGTTATLKIGIGRSLAVEF